MTLELTRIDHDGGNVWTTWLKDRRSGTWHATARYASLTADVHVDSSNPDCSSEIEPLKVSIEFRVARCGLPMPAQPMAWTSCRTNGAHPDVIGDPAPNVCRSCLDLATDNGRNHLGHHATWLSSHTLGYKLGPASS